MHQQNFPFFSSLVGVFLYICTILQKNNMRIHFILPKSEVLEQINNTILKRLCNMKKKPNMKII